MNPKEIMDRFFYRKCPFAIKTTSGFYVPVYRDVTEVDIQKHLDGIHIIGAYNSRADSTCRWACIDFDDFSYEDIAKRIANEVGLIYKDIVKETLFEQSPSKGFHVWFFFNRVSSTEEAYIFISSVMRNYNLTSGRKSKIDVFPRSPLLSGKRVSWQVRIPR